MTGDDPDPTVTKVAKDWLAQYARFLRADPDVIKRLEADSDEFELVPVPRVLLDRLAIPGIMNSGSLGGTDEDLERVYRLATDETDPPAPAAGDEDDAGIRDVLDRLAAALSRGDADAVLALFSPGYVDVDGRGLPEIRAILDGLIDATASRRLAIAEARVTRHSAQHASVRCLARWSAEAGAGGPVAEDVQLDVTVVRGPSPAGRWHIVDLLTA